MSSLDSPCVKSCAEIRPRPEQTMAEPACELKPGHRWHSRAGARQISSVGAFLPHKCGVPARFGTPHLCGSEEFCRAPLLCGRDKFPPTNLLLSGEKN